MNTSALHAGTPHATFDPDTNAILTRGIVASICTGVSFLATLGLTLIALIAGAYEDPSAPWFAGTAVLTVIAAVVCAIYAAGTLKQLAGRALSSGQRTARVFICLGFAAGPLFLMALFMS